MADEKYEPDYMVKSIRVACNGTIDYLGAKNYRSVYGKEEIEHLLFVDAVLLNRQKGKKNHPVELSLRLYIKEEKEGVCVAQKNSKLEVGEGEVEIQYEEFFGKEDLEDGIWHEGIYRVVLDIEGEVVHSDDIYIMEGTGLPEEYFHVLHAGLDRYCDETEAAASVRAHSFQTLALEGLKNIRFYFVANNLKEYEWVYEFFIRVLNRDGRTKIVQIAKAAQFVETQNGDSLLSFMIDLGLGDENFWEKGEYSLIVSGFGHQIFTLGFSIGDEDIPYDFTQDIRNERVPLFKKRQELAYSVKDKDEILDRIYQLVGLRKVKEEVTQISDYAEFIRLRRENGFMDKLPQMHLIFEGHAGTGKSTVAGLLGELYRTFGLLASNRVNHYSRNDFVRESDENEEQIVRQILAKNAGSVIYIENIGDFFYSGNSDEKGKLALYTLVNILINEKPDVLVILADDTDAMDDIQAVIPDIQKAFPRKLYFEDYTAEELMQITRNKLEKLQFKFSPSAEEKFYKLLKANCGVREAEFTNGHYIDERIEDATVRMSRRLMANSSGHYTKDELMLIVEEDIVTDSGQTPEKSLEKLNTMIGMKQLKSDIMQHFNYVYFIRERQKNGFADVIPSLNMIFSGNPGTGKMTVAKMMGEIYHSMGVLSRANVITQDARSFSLDSGMNPQQMAAVLLNAAMGGILYIEHADALTQSEFGMVFFESLLTNTSTDEANDLIIIIGGYPDKMAAMLEANPGIPEFFPYQFHFNDYEPAELVEIAENKLKEKDYTFHPKAKEAFEALISKVSENRNKRFGNVLLVEKIVDIAIRNMSERTMKIRENRELTRQEMTTIRKDDIPVDLFDIPKYDKDEFNEQAIELALTDLNNIVGQAKIKTQIYDFVELARHYSKEGVKLSSKMSLQWIFTGNSAMGKGTVARIIARLYKAMGVINKGEVVDFKVEKLIGMMEDEASRCIGDAINQASGGILLFDEDSPKLNEAIGFRERVRAILMNQMVERPGSVIVIYAEPKRVMSGFNKDVEHISELANVLVFEDYTKDELMIILKRRLEKENMHLTTTARQYMSGFIGLLVTTEERSHASSRLMRIVADMIVRNSLQRVAKNNRENSVNGIISVQKKDVVMFDEQFIKSLMNERKRIGFV